MGIVTLLPFVCACACCDLKTRRIPNALICCGLAGALLSRILAILSAAGLVYAPAWPLAGTGTGFPPASLLNGTCAGFSPANLLNGTYAGFSPGTALFFLGDGLAGFLLPWLCFGLLAALKMIGGGDVKLLSVIGLQLGARSCLRVIWYSLLFGAVWSAIIVIRRRNLAQRLHYLYRYVQSSLSAGRLIPYRSPAGFPSEQNPISEPGCRQTDPPSGCAQADRSGEFCFAIVILAALLYVLSGAPGL